MIGDPYVFNNSLSFVLMTLHSARLVVLRWSPTPTALPLGKEVSTVIYTLMFHIGCHTVHKSYGGGRASYPKRLKKTGLDLCPCYWNVSHSTIHSTMHLALKKHLVKGLVSRSQNPGCSPFQSSARLPGSQLHPLWLALLTSCLFPFWLPHGPPSRKMGWQLEGTHNLPSSGLGPNPPERKARSQLSYVLGHCSNCFLWWRVKSRMFLVLSAYTFSYPGPKKVLLRFIYIVWSEGSRIQHS